MTDIRPSILTTGTQSLRSYEKDGVHRQASPVENYHRFSYFNLLVSSTGASINFFIEEDMQLLSFYIGIPSGTTINSNSRVMVSTYSFGSPVTSNSTLEVELSIPALPLNLGTLIIWEPKFLIMQKDWTLYLNFNFNINRILFYGKTIYLESNNVGRVYEANS
jgi:hypothetical protein